MKKNYKRGENLELLKDGTPQHVSCPRTNWARPYGQAGKGETKVNG